MILRNGCYYFILAILAAAACIYPIACWGQEEALDGAGARFIEHFDTDGDGLVSAAEFPAGEDEFNQLDMDEDGYLDSSEAPAPPMHGGPGGHTTGKDIMSFDSDGDGQLSQTEFPGPADHFEMLDLNDDGFLDADELAAGPPGPPPMGSGFENDDADQDGQVSKNEFSGPVDLFEKMDANGDGYITRDEILPPGRR